MHAESAEVVSMREELRVGRHAAPSVCASIRAERDQRLGCVDPVRLAAAPGNEAQECADAAADVEHALPGLEANTLERRLVGRDLEVLASAQSAGRAPQSGPQRDELPVTADDVVTPLPSTRLWFIVISYVP